MSARPVLRLAGQATRTARPTKERARQAARQGGIARIAGNDDIPDVHAVRYPMLIDYLRDAGRLSASDHEVALQVRELYERTDFRAHVTAAYVERTSRTTGESASDEANDRYRRLETRVLRRAGRAEWTALRAIVIEDRMTSSASALPAALKEASRWL